MEEAFVRGLVRTKELATATANSSDHYVLIPPGGEPRFLTVEEVMRAFGVPSDGPLWHALRLREGVLSPQQAVSCLGRSIHVGVARRLLATLMERGLLGRSLFGLKYGSSFSEIDRSLGLT